ncbi:MAG: hypothetical protein QNK37_10745 [Acidobacteriota bacterium]|nr:hypothetical protein [Acidobacteriota bacterium]
MIGHIDLTYSRYQQSPARQMDRQPELPVQPAAPTRSAPMAGLADSLLGDDRELHDMVLRLNKKAPLFQSDVSFELEDRGKQPPRILMKGGETGEIIGRYETRHLVDLERSLYEMAGFRLSIEG